MFKTLYGFCGELSNDLTSFATAIQVDDSLLSKLRLALTGTDYTYLIIKTSSTYEIVRTTSFVGTSIGVIRAQEGSIAQAFSIGDAVEFVMGDQAIADIINQKMLGDVTITGEGIISVTKNGPNDYSIYAPPITITSESDKVLVGGEFPDFVLSAPLVSGCCD